MKYLTKSIEVEAFTFDEVVAMGLDVSDNVVDGVPWAFSLHGTQFTHETNDRYILGGSLSDELCRGDVWVVMNGAGCSYEAGAFAGAFEPAMSVWTNDVGIVCAQGLDELLAIHADMGVVAEFAEEWMDGDWRRLPEDEEVIVGQGDMDEKAFREGAPDGTVIEATPSGQSLQVRGPARLFAAQFLDTPATSGREIASTEY